MANSPTISVLIPVYNTAKWLPRCMDSLLGQTLGDIEIVAVDDCTPDRAGEMLDEYARRDPRVVVVHKERNEGLMCARKAGYRKARGRYVVFCDSDDYLPLDALRTLYDAITAADADIAVGNWETVNPQGRKVLRNRAAEVGTTWDSYLRSILNWGTPTLCANMYRKSLFDHHDFAAEIGLNQSEDRCLLTELLVSTHPTVAPVDRVVYYYCANEASTTHEKVSDDRVAAQFKALYRAYDYIEEHTDDFTADNDRQMTLWLSLYIERGVDAAFLKSLNPHNARLLEYGRMAASIGKVKALHTRLCMAGGLYRSVMHSVRLAVRRLQGKD